MLYFIPSTTKSLLLNSLLDYGSFLGDTVNYACEKHEDIDRDNTNKFDVIII